jgi:hypothetical protein
MVEAQVSAASGVSIRGGTYMRRVIILLALASTLLAQPAWASQVISTSTGTGIKLGVNDKGQAFLSYTSGGKNVEVLAWGAENAIPPNAGGQQVAFQLDYSGGYTLVKGALATATQKLRDDQALFRKAQVAATALGIRYTAQVTKYSAAVNLDYADIQKIHDQSSNLGKTFSCPKYTGAPLAWMVTACTAPDGSYWAVQSWQRQLPDYGVAPTPTEAAWEVHLSHWTGPLPQLTINTDWAWHQWDHIFGTYTYAGNPVFGFKSTSVGAPLDTFGRNVYVDTFDSKYGAGWIRENSFLTHMGTGVFCYSFNPHGNYPAGNGLKYRATILGPGVTPDVMWEGTPPGVYNQAADAAANAQITALHDNVCRAN